MMRRAAACSAVVLLLSAAAVRASVVHGIIRADRIDGAPIPNVQLTAPGANPAASATDGTFLLEFPGKEQTRIVHLDASKDGYVVVNAFQLLLQLPRKREDDLLLVMCLERDREEMARRFYGLKGFEAVGRTYERRIAELRNKNKATEKAVAALRAERDQAFKAATEAANELAKLRPESTSVLYQQAVSLFLDGKVEQALQLLRAKVGDAAAALRRRETELEEERARVVETYLLEARLHTTLFQFKEAEESHRAAVDLAPDSFEARFALAWFQHNLRRLAQARATYRTALEIAARQKDRRATAQTLNNLGNVDLDEDLIDEARKNFESAIAIWRELAAETSDAAPANLAHSLNNLGNLEHHQNHPAEARAAYESALAIYRSLATSRPAFRQDLAHTLNNLGILLREENQMDQALRAHEEAVAVFRELALRSGDALSDDLSMALANLGIAYERHDQIADARRVYLEALEIRRKLAANNAEAHRRDIGTLLVNLGVLDDKENRLEDAAAHFEAALTIQRELALSSPASELHPLAAALANLGVVYGKLRRFGDAEASLREALRIRRELAMKAPDRYLPLVADTLNGLAVLKSMQDDRDGARALITEALGIERQIAAKRGKPTRELAGMLLNLGLIDRHDESRFDAVRAAMEESVSVYRALAAAEPDVYTSDLAAALQNLGNFFDAHDRSGDAAQALEEALGIYRALAGKVPSLYERDVAAVLHDVALTYAAQTRLDDAGKSLEAAIEIRRANAPKNVRWRADLAKSLSALALVRSLQGRAAEGRKHAEEALAIFESLALTSSQYADEVRRLKELLTELQE
jgi:tetratricopeptide (TPR) repeat protein